MKFSTHDQDNDETITINCASRDGGGWWYNSCKYACLTGDSGSHGWWTLSSYYIINSRMMIQPNTDMTGTATDWVGIVMLIVTFIATKSAQIMYHA